MDAREILHSIIVAAHVISSSIATFMVFSCNVSKANQQATIPYALPSDPEYEIAYFRAAYPWAEDEEYTGNVWNPYALIFAFEWITAAFGICNLKSMLKDAQDYACIWLVAGFILLVIWSCLNYHSLSLIMSLVLFWSYVATYFICSYFDEVHGKTLAATHKKKSLAPPARSNQVVHPAQPEERRQETPGPMDNSESFLMVTDAVLDGRIWYGLYTNTFLHPSEYEFFLECTRLCPTPKHGKKVTGNQ